MLEIILSQGRIGDRSNHTIPGAARTAQALEVLYGLRARKVGRPIPAAIDNWRASLTQARETLTGLADAVTDCLGEDVMVVMVANTCAASLASLPVVTQAKPDAAVLWIDAHGDFNTPATTRSGYLGGMVLAAACGLWDSGHGAGLRPEQTIVIGARDIEEEEVELLCRAGVRLIAPSSATPQTVLEAIGDREVWIHIDWDALEPGFVPAEYAVPDGLLPAQLRKIFEALIPSRILGLEIAEFHPGDDEDMNLAAISTILDTIAPLIEGRVGVRAAA